MKNGFTFLEIIVVIFVVTVGLVAVFGFVQYPVSTTTYLNSRLTATYLAQEGMEIVRNLRDENWLNARAWNHGLVKDVPPGFNGCDPGPPKRFCEADYSSTELEDYPASSQDPHPLKINGYYQYALGNDTRFARKINIYDAGSHLEVIVVVTWLEKGEAYEVNIQENLYDWRN